MRWFSTIILWIVLLLNTILLFPVVVFAFILDRSGALPHRCIRVWAKHNLHGGFFRWTTVQNASLDKSRSYVIVSNHASLFDINVLAALLPLQFKFISRREFFLMPFWGWCMRMARYIEADRNKPRQAARAVLDSRKWLRKGFSILAFPEGARSEDGQINRFKKGAFRLAMKAGAPILPVTLVGTNRVIPKHTLFIIPCRIVMVLGEPVETKNTSTRDLPKIVEHVKEQIIKNYEKHVLSTGPRSLRTREKAQGKRTAKRSP